MSRHDVVAAVEPIAPLPRDPEGGPVFREPWEAQAFAMTLCLHERGLFTWSEWTQALGETIEAARAENETSYYQHWLAALERLVAEKGIASPDVIEARRAAWDRAARATPHGQPIRLANDPHRQER